MKSYTLKIEPISPFLTPLESDTLFGHICWALEYLGGFTGSKNLTNFLEEFDKQNPPLIMTNAFPAGYLPFPLLPPFTNEEKVDLRDRYIEKGKGDEFGFIQWLKELSRQEYIALDTFFQYRHAFSKYDLYAAVLEGTLSGYRFSKFSQDSAAEVPEVESQTVEVYHNAIDRITGKVKEGQLFSKNSTFYKQDVRFHVYLKTGYFTIEELKKIFEYISMNGFGADKSTGSGRFEFELEPGVPFNDIEDFNAYLLFSNTHPSVLQHHSSYYTTQTKFGKLGGTFSTNSKYSPFKYPVILLNPGSVILSQESAEFFGENFNEVHPQLSQVRHYGIGYPVKMRLKNEL
jgi:CRISPR-associated protein Csm4